jgi:hypothetical protein
MADVNPLLFVPACPIHEPGLAPYGVEVRRLVDGRYGCLAFSTVARLTAALGSHQPWVGVPAGALVHYLERLGVDSLYVDSAVPDEAWRWQPDELTALVAREDS